MWCFFLGSALSWETSSRLVQENGGKCGREGKGGNLPRNNRFAKSKKGKVSEWEQGSEQWEVSGKIFLHFVFYFFLTIYGPTSFSNLWQFYGWRSDEQKQAGDKMCMLMNLRMCVLINFEICVIILTTDIPLPCNCLNMHIIFLYAFMFPFHIIFINPVLSDFKTSPPFLSF